MKYLGKRKIWLDYKGYPCVWVDGKNVKVHVFLWENENGDKPKGKQLHHIDGNKGNYDLNNLILVSQSDHFRIHAGWKMTDNIWTHKPCTLCNKLLMLENFYKRKGLPPSAKCKNCSKKHKITSTLNMSEERKIKNREYQKLWARKKRKEVASEA